ncbi:hypothetical protein [Nitrospira sp. Nam74]
MRTFARSSHALFKNPELNLLHEKCGQLIPAIPGFPLGRHPRVAEVLQGLKSCRLYKSNSDFEFYAEAAQFLIYALLPPPDLWGWCRWTDLRTSLLRGLCLSIHLAGDIHKRLMVTHEMLTEVVGKNSAPSTDVSEKDYPLYFLYMHLSEDLNALGQEPFQAYGVSTYLALTRVMTKELAAIEQGRPHRSPFRQSIEYDTAIALRRFLTYCPIPFQISGCDTDPKVLWTAFYRALRRERALDDSRHQSGKLLEAQKTVENNYNLALAAFEYSSPRRWGSRVSRYVLSLPRMISKEVCRLRPQPNDVSRQLIEWRDTDMRRGSVAVRVREVNSSVELTAAGYRELLENGESLHEEAKSRLELSRSADIPTTSLQKRIYQSHLAAQAQRGRLVCFWTGDILSISALAGALVFIVKSYLREPCLTTAAALASFALVLFHGMRPYRVESATIRLSDEGLKSDSLAPISLVYDAKHRALAYQVDGDVLGYTNGSAPEFVNQCRSASPVAYLPLGQLASGLMRCYLTHRPLPEHIPSSLRQHLFLVGSDGSLGKGSIAGLDRVLASCGPFNKVCVTSEAVARSFLVHATTQFGLDPICACYVTADVPRQYRAQMAYTYVSQDRLWSDAASIDVQFTRLILAEIDQHGAASAEVAAFLQGSVTEGGKCESIVPNGYQGTGTRCVMTDAHIQEFNRGIKEAITKLTDRAAADQRLVLVTLLFNLLMVHNYLLFSFATGLRPRRIPPVNAATVRLGQNSRVLIRDKHNKRFNMEPRQIPLPPLACQGLVACAAAGDMMETYLRRRFIFINKWLEREGQPYFYLLTEDGHPIHLSPARLTDVLASIDDLLTLFLVPVNAGRHYLRTSLFEARWAWRMIDLFIGHVHEGEEPLGVFSAARIHEAEQHFIEHVEPMLRKLGFKAATLQPSVLGLQ